jgi:hypothetical protein
MAAVNGCGEWLRLAIKWRILGFARLSVVSDDSDAREISAVVSATGRSDTRSLQPNVNRRQGVDWSFSRPLSRTLVSSPQGFFVIGPVTDNIRLCPDHKIFVATHHRKMRTSTTKIPVCVTLVTVTSRQAGHPIRRSAEGRSSWLNFLRKMLSLTIPNRFFRDAP